MKKIFLIGNAHLDPVWLWQWQEGYQEIKATYRSALDRIRENDDFIFTTACAGYFEYIEENDPPMFEEIRARVKEGRIALVGGMWIQPDMNTPSGESIARQLLYSQRYFMEKFGVTADTGYNVDTFGHNAMLPQLLRKAGIGNYVWMRPGKHENAAIPAGPHIWEAPDGSRVNAYHIFGEYVCFHEVGKKIEESLQVSAEIGYPVMCFYGVGNHGGGPTIENLKEIDRFIAENPHGSEAAYASAPGYFNELNAADLPVWRGELQHHASGCYSTHSRTKKLHRETENALLRAENFAALSGALTGFKEKKEFVDQAWKDLMFNEFHDICGGCCLREALEDAEKSYGEALTIAAREENAALQKISWQIDTAKGNPLRVRSKEEDGRFWGINGQGTPVVVFNPFGYEAVSTVLLRGRIGTVKDDGGNTVPCQNIRATRTNGADDRFDTIFRAKVPPLGYRLYWAFTEKAEETAESGLRIMENSLENDRIYAAFDPETGMLSKLVRKSDGRDFLAGKTRLVLSDIEHCDTWAHMVFSFDRYETPVIREAVLSIEETGPVRAVLRSTVRFNESEIVQRYILYADADQLETEVRLDMHEKFRMLKLSVPTPFKDNISEIPYGVLRRPANGEEQPCQRFIAMEGADAGLALLNDGKYSYSAKSGEMLLTLANTSLYADHYGQNYRDDSCEHMDIGVQRFRYAFCPYGGEAEEYLLSRKADLLNRSFPEVTETYHEGKLPAEYSGISLDNEKVEVSVVKKAEDGSGFVLRLRELSGTAQKVRVRFGLASRAFDLEFAGYELKTVYVPESRQENVREVLLTEYNKE